MTHFVVLIIIPKDIYLKGIKAVKIYIADKMYQYSENLEVEPYIKILSEDLKLKFENYEKKDSYESIEEFAKDYYGYDLDEYGNALSTYNNNALYDWYEIGGRWNGLFNNCESDDLLKDNSIFVEDLLNDFYQTKKTYSTIVDCNGIVHKNKEMGWWGTYDELESENEWLPKYQEILEKYKDDYIVNLDCHI